jgi:hypothetical protein
MTLGDMTRKFKEKRIKGVVEGGVDV